MILHESIIQENFLSESELDYIADTVFAHNKIYNDVINNFQYSEYYTWEYYKSNFADIKDILHNKFIDLIGPEMIIDHSHILSSTTPYGIHTDYFQERNFTNIEPAYTLIIPLADYDSNTIAFEQTSTIKSIRQWIDTTCPKTLPDKKRIPESFVDRYLSHINPEYLNYLSFKEIFPWKKGHVYACDRKHFHTSDNYHTRGIDRKNALIFWTSIKTN